jgi:hypothetical protein
VMANTHVTVAVWKPTDERGNEKPLDKTRHKKCIAMIAKAMADAKKHEMKHVEDIRKIEARAKAAYPPEGKTWRVRNSPSEYRVCGSNTQEAEVRLEERLSKSLQEYCKQLGDEIESKAEDYHKHPIDPLGKGVSYTCSKCPPPPPHLCPQGDVLQGQVLQADQCGGNPAPPKSEPAPTQVYCNCNKKCYDDVQVCLNECKVTLGCFTGICGPAEPEQCPARDEGGPVPQRRDEGPGPTAAPPDPGPAAPPDAGPRAAPPEPRPSVPPEPGPGGPAVAGPGQT